jgi:DNA processing protein
MEWSDIVGALSFQIPGFTNEDFKVMSAVKPQEALFHPEISTYTQEFIRLNSNWIRDSEIILKDLKKHGVNWLLASSPEYPERFRWMQEPPPFLTYIGELACLKRSVLSVVGSREPSLKGKEFLNQELGSVLQKVPMTIVSGAARGIDQAAHACAIRNNCPTAAIMPSGILNPYPRGFNEWYEPILSSGGCIISEYPPDKFMHRHYFFRRNQIIVGLTKFVLVIEARRKSGTMMTARHALDNHCTVAVVPGSPLDPQYGGSLDLLSDNAQLIRDHLDILTMLANDGNRHSS